MCDVMIMMILLICWIWIGQTWRNIKCEISDLREEVEMLRRKIGWMER